MRIIQFVHTLNYGDAISGEALLIRDLAREAGYQSDIYCVHVHEKLKGQALNYQSINPADLADCIILLHHSIASPLNKLFQRSYLARRGIIYHNLTPAKWFTEYNPRVEQDLIYGREESYQSLFRKQILLLLIRIITLMKLARTCNFTQK